MGAHSAPAPHPASREAYASHARTRVAEFLRQFDMLRDTGGVVLVVRTDPTADEGAALTSADLHALVDD